MYTNSVDLENLSAMNGEVIFDGLRYILTRPPYLDYDSRIGENVYRAEAITNKDEDDRYRITWEIEDPDCDDEAYACDWDAPTEIWDSQEYKAIYTEYIA